MRLRSSVLLAVPPVSARAADHRSPFVLSCFCEKADAAKASTAVTRSKRRISILCVQFVSCLTKSLANPFRATKSSPHATGFFRAHHRLAFLAAKGVPELRHVRDCADQAEFPG